LYNGEKPDKTPKKLHWI